MAVLAALGVGIYHAVDIAIKDKVEDCLTKHFNDNHLFKSFNITPPADVATISYSTEDCKSIVEKGYEKSRSTIDQFPYDDCVKRLFKNKPFLDTILMYVALTKQGHNATAILTGAATKAGDACKSQVN